MSMSSPFRLFPSKFPLSLHPKFPISKNLISSKTNFRKPLFFSSIFIERLPTKTAASSPVTSSSLQSIEDLPTKLQEIINLFQSVQEPKAKYEQLLFYGRNLNPLDTKFKTKENKVQGCVSQVWVRAYLDSDKNVVFEADSDSVLTKGLAALLVQGLSGQPVYEILKVSPDFITLLGLKQSLTPSRNNGFLNMLNMMQKKALEVYKEAEEGSGSISNGALEVETEAESTNLGSEVETSHAKLNESVKFEAGTDNSNSGEGGIEDHKSNIGVVLGSRGQRIKDILERELSPDELEVEDISHQHAGHAGVRGSAGETHFNLRVISKEFEGKSMVKRHRLVYALLQEELQSGLHALSIVAKTPSEV